MVRTSVRACVALAWIACGCADEVGPGDAGTDAGRIDASVRDAPPGDALAPAADALRLDAPTVDALDRCRPDGAPLCPPDSTCERATGTCRCADHDHDGHTAASCGGTDCDDDSHAAVDELDFFPDCDGDGLGPRGTPATHACPTRLPALACSGGSWARLTGDCDDTRADVRGDSTVYADCDRDGYAPSSARTSSACGTTPPPPVSCASGAWVRRGPHDCDDADADRHPGMTETCNAIDDDCDGRLGAIEDADGDGHALPVCGGDDCDDAHAAAHPGADEICDGLDDDCDGVTDGALATAWCEAVSVHTDSVSCTAGSCVIGACSAGYTDCVAAIAGCETNLANDPRRCGACDVSCGAGGCDAGVCDDPAVSIGMGYGISCVVRASGRAVCAGHGYFGAVDGTLYYDGPVAPKYVPLADLVAADPDWLWTCGVRTGGRVSCWGDGRSTSSAPPIRTPTLGDGTTLEGGPVEVVGIADATAVAVGYRHVCVLRAGGAVACWGANERGEVGDGTTTARSVPVPVVGIDDAVSIGVASGGALALRATGDIVSWGLPPSDGPCGATSTTTAVPWTVMPGPVAELAVDGPDACARLVSGEVYWAHDDILCQPPSRVAGADGLVGLSICFDGGCGIDPLDGRVLCWGRTNILGDGSTADRASAAPVPGIRGARQVVATQTHVCALLDDGTLRCWGGNYYGELNDVSGPASLPVEVQFP